jgi:peptidoglycan/xylan/chitin deacetylase (PgdA/CDA1 family)
MERYTDGRIVQESLADGSLTAWPNAKGVAVWIVINVECWPHDYLGPGGMPWPQSPPDVPNTTYREYGNKVGVWRLIRMLDGLSLPASIALNGAMCGFYPDIVSAFVQRKWDIMGHGVDQSRALNRIPPEEERLDIESTLANIANVSGQRPLGWLSPGMGETAATPDLLAAQGVKYVADRLDHHLPYEVQTNSGPLIAVPYSLDLNDYSAFSTMALTGEQYGAMLRDQFEVLQAEAEAQNEARVMCIPLHTYLSGVPHRSKHIAEALSFMKDHESAWFTTGAAIAEAFETHMESRAQARTSGPAQQQAVAG